uniref:Uncharacterized protein n=1 Tax=Romanomermis culicivorax TaxID=13658 RepID=A0A915IEJ6_ROMCU
MTIFLLGARASDNEYHQCTSSKPSQLEDFIFPHLNYTYLSRNHSVIAHFDLDIRCNLVVCLEVEGYGNRQRANIRHCPSKSSDDDYDQILLSLLFIAERLYQKLTFNCRQLYDEKLGGKFEFCFCIKSKQRSIDNTTGCFSGEFFGENNYPDSNRKIEQSAAFREFKHVFQMTTIELMLQNRDVWINGKTVKKLMRFFGILSDRILFYDKREKERCKTQQDKDTINVQQIVLKFPSDLRTVLELYTCLRLLKVDTKVLIDPTQYAINETRETRKRSDANKKKCGSNHW